MIISISIGLLSGVLKVCKEFCLSKRLRALLMIYQQILDMEDEPNQKIISIATLMSDIAVCVADVKQFTTIDQLINVIKKANNLIGQTVEFFNKYKERGSLGEYSLID